MREILFRGKQDGGDWVYGLPYEIKEKYSSICKINPYPIGGGWFVLSATLGQYTGLTDKNGKKIFEGDILKVRQLNSEDFEIAKICFGEFNEDKTYYLGFYAELKDGMQFSLIGGKSIVSNLENFYEIIGNIHDNPELLEEGGDGDSRTEKP